MRYEGAVFRPPSEAYSLILQATLGCSQNTCTFCGMYKDKKYRERDLNEIKEDIRSARMHYGDVTRVFLADGDALALDTEKLLEILQELYTVFPHIDHLGIYASPKSILNKSPEELKTLKEHGLTIAYYGVETGDPELLKEVRKGFTRDEMVEAGKKVVASGIDLSVTLILGLAGSDREKSERHALHSAEVCSEINPQFLSALTLMLVPGTVMYRKAQRGEFVLPNPFEVLRELRTLVEGLYMKDPCVFRTNHASNYLPIKGTLPQDKAAILQALDMVLQKKDDRYLRPDYLRGL
ncbi:MAG: radical SAM protein [Firmicutes bacterium]|nr:radical SAM protein [Bacillota bacterium]